MRRLIRWVGSALRYGPRVASRLGRLRRSVSRNQTRINALREKFKNAADNQSLQRLYALEEQEALERIDDLNRQINNLTN